MKEQDAMNGMGHQEDRVTNQSMLKKYVTFLDIWIP
jgi:hypothetical protein